MRVVAGWCIGALLAGAPFASSSYDIATWVEASYRCGEFPGVPRVLDSRNDQARSAVAEVEVSADGNFAAVELSSPSGSDAFDRGIIEAVRTWRFAPRIKEGRPQATSIGFRFDRLSTGRETVVTTVGMPRGRDFQLQPKSCDTAP